MQLKSLPSPAIPKERGVLLLNPEPHNWMASLRRNQELLEHFTDRTTKRTELLDIARGYTEAIADTSYAVPSPAVIATGHQATWHHCGILVKSIVADKIARKTKSTCLHIVVDHDIYSTAMSLPIQNNDSRWLVYQNALREQQVSYPVEYQEPCHDEELLSFLHTSTSWSQTSMCAQAWRDYEAIVKNTLPQCHSIADTMVGLLAYLYRDLGLNMLFLPVSQLCQSQAFLQFAASSILRAQAFASSYNTGIMQQTAMDSRHVKRLKALALDHQTSKIELPFWLSSPHYGRQSLFIQRESKDLLNIIMGSQKIGVLKTKCEITAATMLQDMLNKYGIHLRPKAVTLTLFVRLFLADWFIHGVGGSSYEPLVDHMMREYYGMDQTKYGVATCTMTLPIADTVGQHQESTQQLDNQFRRLKYTPEDYLDASSQTDTMVKTLIENKQMLIDKSRDYSLGKTERHRAWQQINSINTELNKYVRSQESMIQEQQRKAEELRQSEEICNSRDYFFGLFPKHTLLELLQTCDFRGA